MRRFKRLFKIFGILYLALCLGLYLGQDQLIFNPNQLPENYSFRAGEEVRIAVEEGIELHSLWLREPDSKGVILYWHGNRGSNRRCLRQAQNMSGNSYDIFMPDYRGFGKSKGEMESESQMLADAQAVYDWLKERYREDQIVLAGYSLGSGPATYLAAHNHPQQLFLLAPYRSMVHMKDRVAPFIPDFLLKYPLRSDRFMEQVQCPVTIFHGTADEVIPYENGVALQQVRPERTQLITLQNVSHRGTIFSDLFRRQVRHLLYP